MLKSVSAEEFYESAMMQAIGGDKPAAVLQLQEALLLKPDYDMAWNNRGNFLLQLGHPFDAILHYDKAIEVNDKVAEYHNNRGAAFASMSKFSEAYDCYAKALKLKPKFDEALVNTANIQKLKGDVEEAIKSFRKALEVNPKHTMAKLHLAFALLEDGQLKEGWEAYESRWQSGQIPPRGLSYPEWKGEDLTGKTLLVYAEQGNGDTLQFVRYAPLVKKKYDCKVLVEVRTALTRLIETMDGIDGVHTFGGKLPEGIDYCISMLSLPRLMGTDSEKDIPWSGPYLKTDPYMEKSWAKKLELLPARPIRVGVCWAGMSRPHQPLANETDKRRSMRLADMSLLALVPGVAWVSLQKGPPSEQALKPPPGMTIGDWSEDMDDFYETAALVNCLDLVITVDTAVAHLAGALGKPVWMLSRFDGCWRWMGDRPDSPWYPSLRQFRQTASGQWEPMMEQVAVELGKFVREHTATKAA